MLRAVAVAVLAALLFHSHGRAAAADDDPVVLSVAGTEVHASEVTARIAMIPLFQLRTLGKTPAEIRRRVIETVLVPELLLAAAATERKLADQPQVRSKIREVYSRLLQKDLRTTSRETHGPSDAEVAAYYEKNKSHFVTPQRIHLWRILVSDEALARKIIAEVQGVDGPEKWKSLARQHSEDPATAMRAGDLGFVDETGQSHISQLRVDPALFKAAQPVADGDLVPTPVKEGKHFAIVWRRGSLAGSRRTLESERRSIEQILARKRQMDGIQQLLDRLEKQYVRDKHPAFLAELPKAKPEPAAPSARPTLPAPGRESPAPTQTPTGLR